MKYLKIHIIAIFTLFSSFANGQQSALYSQYIFNLYVINPAYAGFRDALSANVGYRAQWLGIEGAPTTQHFTLTSPLKAPNMAVGLMVQNDEIGARKSPSVSFAYAYAIRLDSEQRIRFGIQGGMMNYQVNWSQLEYSERNDPVSLSIDGNKWIATFDFGIMYTAPKSYVGLSVNGLNQSQVNFTPYSDGRLSTTYNAVAGKVFPLSELISVKPCFLIRYTPMAPVQVDLNISMLLANRVWISGIYRKGFGVITAAHCYVTDRFHVGYSFDWAVNNLADYQNGTHEVFIGFDFNIYKSPANPSIYY
jgi:type IX secretion system PorP/SprF family membrane protein